MAISHVFSDYLLKEPPESKYKGVRLELAFDKIVTCIAVGLPLLLISLAFAQEVTVGTQISCFPPQNFSWRQGIYVDSFCWAAVQQQSLSDSATGHVPLWLHKFFPYILLLVAVLMYVPSLFWRLIAAPHLHSDLTFMMEELDNTYNQAIKLAKSLAVNEDPDALGVPLNSPSIAINSTDTRFRYPLLEWYLKSKKLSRSLVVKYLICRALTLVILLLACLYLGYYINLASTTDEFTCDLRTGLLRLESGIPPAFQCKLVAVGIFLLLSYTHLIVYILLAPVVVYTMLVPWRQNPGFLKAYETLPTFKVLDLTKGSYDDLCVFLLFLEENLSELKSYKRVKVFELLVENGVPDPMHLLRDFVQVKTDTVDGKVPSAPMANNAVAEFEKQNDDVEMKEISVLLPDDGLNEDRKCSGEKSVRQRVI